VEDPARDGRDRGRYHAADEVVALGQLADRLEVSKSGLFAHWKSKEELQLATIEHARNQWAEHVIGPALREPKGVRRLWALHDLRLAFYEGGRLPGGCFFANANFEYNARPGAIRDRLGIQLEEWMEFLVTLATDAVAGGDLRAGTDARAIAYETESLGVCAVMQAPTLGAGVTFNLARNALLGHLRALAVDPSILPELT